MIAVVSGHLLLLAAYTFPAQVVPLRLRYWSQAYARVLFHQDWRLFAPDPPKCGCSVEVKVSPEGPWQRLEDVHHHFIWRRMAANLCRYAEASVGDDGVIRAGHALGGSLENMVPDTQYLRTQHVFRSCGCRWPEMIDMKVPIPPQR